MSNDAKKASEEAKSKDSTTRDNDVRCESSDKRVEQEHIVI